MIWVNIPLYAERTMMPSDDWLSLCIPRAPAKMVQCDKGKHTPSQGGQPRKACTLSNKD